MADDLQPGTFNEILSIQVDADAFGRSMDEVIQIYAEKIKQMPQLDSLNMSQVTDGLKDIQSALSSLASNVGDVVSTTASQVIDSLDAMAGKVQATVAKVRSTGGGGATGQDLLMAKVNDEESTDEFVKNYQIRQAAAEKVEKAIATANANAVAEMQKREADYYASINEFEAEREAVAEKNRAKDLASMQAQMKAGAANGSMFGAGNGGQSFMGRIGGSIKESAAEFPELLASVGKYVVLWKLVGLAVNAAGKAIMVIPDAIKNGFDYLNKTADSAVELQGIIASSVQYTTNLADNFKEAGLQANEVVKKLQEISLADHIDPDQLTKGFKAFLEGGGAAFVNNMSDAVKLTELFGVAMKASGKDAESTRSLISEIPKLLEGSATDSANLLRVLGLTAAQWEVIRKSALAHGDLLQQLEPRLMPYLNASQQAALIQSDLTKELGLMADRIDGAIALPLWKELTSVMAVVKQYLIDHKTQIAAATAVIGQMVIGFFDIVKAAFQVTGGMLPWQGLLAGAGKAITALITGFNMLSTVTKYAAQDFTQFVGIVFNKDLITKGLSGIKDAYAQFQKDSDNRHNKMIADLTEEGKEMQDVFDGTKTSKAAQDMSAMLDKLFTPLKVPRDISKDASAQLKELEDQYAAAFDAIKQAQAKLIADTKEQLSEHVISHQQAAAQIIGGYQAEGAAMATLVSKTKTGLSQIAGLKDKQRIGFSDKLDKDQQGLNAAGQNGETAQQTELNKFIEQEEDKHNKAMIALDVDAAKQKASLMKQMAAQGQVTQLQAVDADIAAAKKEHDAVTQTYNDELVKYLADDQLFREVLDKQAAEDQKYTEQTKALALQRAAAVEAEVRQKEQQAETLKSLAVQQTQIEADQAKANGASQTEQLQNLEALAVKRRELTELKLADAEADLARAKAADVTDPKTLQALQDQVASLKLQLAAANVNVQTAHDNTTAPTSLTNILFGQNNLGNAFKTASEGAQAITHAFQTLNTSIGSIVTAFSKGILPGIGKMMDMLGGFMSKLTGNETSGLGGMISGLFGKASPIIGAVVGAVGSLFGVISGLFTAQAKKIGAQIDATLKTINDNLNNGAATLSQTIAALQAERQQAIQQLSGKKGGQDQLNQILPQIDQQLASLQQQQQQILTTFQQKFDAINLGATNTVLQQWETTWQSINAEVKQYLDAGGNIATAQAYLNDQLQAQQLQNQQQLNQGQQQAVEDAISLNDLLTQRVDLMNQEKATEFGILNADSLEKRQSSAVVAGQALATQRQQYNTQLDALNEQISLTQQKVDMESQVFSIATDIAALHRQDDALTLAALAQQLDQYKQMQRLIAANLPSTFNPNYIPGITPNTYTTQPIQITIGSINGNGQQVVDEIRNELVNRGRFNMTGF